MQPRRHVGKQALELRLDERSNVAADLLVAERLAYILDDLGRRLGADVGEVEAFFELVEELLIDLAAPAEQIRDATEEGSGLGQALLELIQEFAEHQVLVG